MSKSIEVLNQDYARGQQAAEADGGPRESPAPASPCAAGQPKRTMADRFAGRLGVVASNGDGRLSENTGETFTDYLEEKRRAGTL